MNGLDRIREAAGRDRNLRFTNLMHHITKEMLMEAYGELKKVEWPSQRGVVSGTAVVIVACIVVGIFLYVNDIVWKYVVQHVLLK